MRARYLLGAIALLCVAGLTLGCDECETLADCAAGEACINGECQSSSWTGPDADTDTDTDTDTDVDGDTDTDTDTDPPQLDWVFIPGGSFAMGSDAVGASSSEQPVHEVDVPSFEMTRTEVTVGQFEMCVEDGICDEPIVDGPRENWEVAGRKGHPVNYVEWDHADDFCAWAGGRLPTEAEWEYAARGSGQDITYPWGDETPSCDYCVMVDDEGDWGCGEERSLEPCTRTDGNSDQGLCDMSGNLYEWVADTWHDDYAGAPTDGSAWIEPGGDHIIRGGSYQCGDDHSMLTATGRLQYGYHDPDLGFRCARNWEDPDPDPDAGVDGGADGGV